MCLCVYSDTFMQPEAYKWSGEDTVTVQGKMKYLACHLGTEASPVQLDAFTNLSMAKY